MSLRCGFDTFCGGCTLEGLTENLEVVGSPQIFSRGNFTGWDYCLPDLQNNPWDYDDPIESDSVVEYSSLIIHPNSVLLFLSAVKVILLIWVDCWHHLQLVFRTVRALFFKATQEAETEENLPEAKETKEEELEQTYGIHREYRGLIFLLFWSLCLLLCFSVSAILLTYEDFLDSGDPGVVEYFDGKFGIDCGAEFEGARCIVTRCEVNTTKIFVDGECEYTTNYSSVKDFFSEESWGPFFVILAIVLDGVSIAVALGSSLVIPNMLTSTPEGYRLEGNFLFLRPSPSRAQQAGAPQQQQHSPAASSLTTQRSWRALDLRSVKMCRVLWESELRTLLLLYMTHMAPYATAQQLFLNLARDADGPVRGICNTLVGICGVVLFFFTVMGGSHQAMGLVIRFRFHGLKTAPMFEWLMILHIVVRVVTVASAMTLIGYVAGIVIAENVCDGHDNCESNMHQGIAFIFFVQGTIWGLVSSLLKIFVNWEFKLLTSAFSNCVLVWHSLPEKSFLRRLLFWQYNSRVLLFHPDDPANLTNGVEAFIWRTMHPTGELPSIFKRRSVVKAQEAKEEEVEEDRERQRVLRMPGTLLEMNKSMKPLEVLRRLKVEEELRQKREMEEKIVEKEERAAVMSQFSKWTQQHAGLTPLPADPNAQAVISPDHNPLGDSSGDYSTYSTDGSYGRDARSSLHKAPLSLRAQIVETQMIKNTPKQLQGMQNEYGVRRIEAELSAAMKLKDAEASRKSGELSDDMTMEDIDLEEGYLNTAPLSTHRSGLSFDLTGKVMQGLTRGKSQELRRSKNPSLDMVTTRESSITNPTRQKSYAKVTYPEHLLIASVKNAKISLDEGEDPIADLDSVQLQDPIPESPTVSKPSPVPALALSKVESYEDIQKAKNKNQNPKTEAEQLESKKEIENVYSKTEKAEQSRTERASWAEDLETKLEVVEDLVKSMKSHKDHEVKAPDQVSSGEMLSQNRIRTPSEADKNIRTPRGTNTLHTPRATQNAPHTPRGGTVRTPRATQNAPHTPRGVGNGVSETKESKYSPAKNVVDASKSTKPSIKGRSLNSTPTKKAPKKWS